MIDFKEYHKEKYGDIVLVFPSVDTNSNRGKKRKDSRSALKSALMSAKITKKLRFHDLRHTFAANFINAGGNIYMLQQILGHHDIKVTEIYAHLKQDVLRAEMEKIRVLR